MDEVPHKMIAAIISYEEISLVQRKGALDAELKSIAKDQEIVEANKDMVNASMVKIINACWRQGAALQRACGHEQVTFAFIKGIKDKLPWGSDDREVFALAKGRIALSAKLKKEVKKWDELPPDFRRDVLQQMELLTPQERSAMGPAQNIRNPLVLFLSDMTRLKQSLQKTIRLTPMEEWTDIERDEFLKDTQWIADERDHAAKLSR